MEFSVLENRIPNGEEQNILDLDGYHSYQAVYSTGLPLVEHIQFQISRTVTPTYKTPGQGNISPPRSFKNPNPSPRKSMLEFHKDLFFKPEHKKCFVNGVRHTLYSCIHHNCPEIRGEYWLRRCGVGFVLAELLLMLGHGLNKGARFSNHGKENLQ